MPLEVLLGNIKPEFVLLLLVHCQKIAMIDGVVTAQSFKLCSTNI